MPYRTVEIDLDDFDTNDLIEELEDRGYSILSPNVLSSNDIQEEMNKIWEAMYLGKPYDAMVRKFISDQTGRFL